MTLGHVYDMDLKKNETLIKEVIIQAQGEVGLVSSNLETVY
jgi:dynein heavy chain 1